ncbi:MAG: hypothetical protein QME79_02480 [Bacillota bacterium]|nr:hypothetical protein [Bacillota bacterium]
MARENENKKGQRTDEGVTTVAPGLRGRLSEEYATELGGGRTTGVNTTELGTGAAGGAKRGGAETKKRK